MRESSRNFREGAGNMDLLKRRIIEDGTELGTEVVKVDSFLNHQLDIGLFMAIGKEISRRFGHLGINKILTIESSGIGIAAITALYFDLVPVVFAKKTQPNTMTEDFYGAEVKSFTRVRFLLHAYPSSTSILRTECSLSMISLRTARQPWDFAPL